MYTKIAVVQPPVTLFMGIDKYESKWSSAKSPVINI